MTDPSGMSTAGQFEGLAMMVTFSTVAVAVRARRAKVRRARALRSLRKVSDARPMVWGKSTDRSET